MQAQAVERFRGNLGPCFLGLLARAIENFLEFFLVLTTVGDEHAGGGKVGIIATDHGQGQGPAREFEQLFDADADPLFERLGRIVQPLRQIFLEVLEARVIPELAVLTASEGLAKRFDVIQLEKQDRVVGEDSLGGCRGLCHMCGQTRQTKKSQPPDEGQATNRPLRRMHVRKLHFQAPPRLTGGEDRSGRR